MDKVKISQIKKTPLKIIDNENGNIYHALKKRTRIQWFWRDLFFQNKLQIH